MTEIYNGKRMLTQSNDITMFFLFCSLCTQNKDKMLESYVTPLLMSYVNKYIKNLKPSDLQLSLWGGDVVLSKLDLKLDVLEQVLKVKSSFCFEPFFIKLA